ncbi:MAG: response regulator, partial [Lentisphaerae bacterium]|nr:response regulator [Lentisphaerota bacterium]
EVTCRDGSTKSVQLRASLLGERSMIVMLLDVTARERMQERLRLSERMAAIGRLAGGVAHDFNNLLTPIIGNAELLQESAAPASEEAVLAGQIRAAGTQAAELTRKLLTFARRGPKASAPVDLHHAIRSVLTLLRRSIDRGIELATDLQASCPWTLGDESQVHSALLNLGLNARDAMPQGGRLCVATRDVHIAPGDDRLGDDGVTPGDYVEIRVSDTGTGIPESVRPRIFEPFFTTKEPGKGTGLGLASVYGCVRGHGGSITVASRVGAGTTFTILLPQHPAAAADATRPREAAAVAALGKAHVLVVDDEAGVRDYTTRVLGRLGYAVTACSDGRAALACCRVRPGGYDLVVLDLVMPELGGADTFHALRAMDPGLAVLLISGYDRNAGVDALLRDGARGFLSKPFAARELSMAVAACLAAPSTGPAGPAAASP